MTTILFPAGVLGLALTMLVAHARSWRAAQSRRLNEVDLSFRHGQFRRRMQASSLLAMIAPTMLVGARMSAAESPRIFVTLWLVVTLATCWVLWLAFVDAVASGRHFYQLSRQRSTDRARLKAELDRIVAASRAKQAGVESAPRENA